MGTVFMATADTQTAGMFSYAAYFVSLVTSPTPRTGTYCYEAYNTSTIMRGSFTPITEGYLKFATKSTASRRITLRGDDDNQMTMTMSVSSLEIRRGSYNYSVLDSYSGDLSGWNLIEWHWLIDETVGVAQVKLNGQMIIDFTGDTLQDTGTNTVKYFEFSTGSTGAYLYWDDIVVKDDGWPGQGGLYVVVPNAGSDTENWTASSGNPEDCVDELPVSYTDYLSTPHDPSGVEHLFNIEALPVSGTINAVGVGYNAKLEFATNGNCRNIIRSDSIMASGELRGLDTSERWSFDYFDVDPATSSAWTNEAIELLEIGVEN